MNPNPFIFLHIFAQFSKHPEILFVQCALLANYSRWLLPRSIVKKNQQGCFVNIKKHLSFTALRSKMSAVFREIPDQRKQKKISINMHDALMSGFACMHFQDNSLLQFQTRMQEDQHRNNLNTMFEVNNIPSDTQMRDIIDNVGSDYFSPIFSDFCMRLQRGKQLEKFQLFPNMYYLPMDGSEYYSSKEVYCEKCLRKEHKKDETTYTHHT